MQLDQAHRGFAFSLDGPLDMRMQQSGETAAEWIDRASESEIADTLYLYGEERQSRRVARAIVAARPITRTGELASVVRKALGYRPGAPKDPATRSFQAIRILINDELGELERGLEAAERVLAPGGRLAIIPAHRRSADQKRGPVYRGGDGYLLPGDEDALIFKVEVPDRSFCCKKRNWDLLGEHTSIQHHGCLRRRQRT